MTKQLKTIILAEDEEQIRSLVQHALEGEGYRVLVASNGEEALQLVARRPGEIDLLITNAVMPGMSGNALALHLRAIYPKMQVLYVSGYFAGESVDRCLDDPAAHFLWKPFTIQALRGKVAELLEGGL